MKIFCSKTPAVKAPDAGAPSPSATRKTTPVRNQNQQPNRSLQLISRREEIPFHVSVLSNTGGALALPEEWQKSYAILLTNREKKEVEIICSTELIKKSGVNDDLLTIVEQIKRGGYTRTRKWMAKPDIISIIYESIENQKSLEDQQRAATKIQIEFDDLIQTAINSDVSDIHIQVRRDQAEVRFRANGDMYVHTQWPVRYARTMAGVIYQVIADEKDTTFDEQKPQDAIIDRDLGQLGRVRLRLATIPAYPAGFDMIMRILKMGVSGKRRSLESLGYNRTQLSNLRRAVAKPVGAVVMAGTTGSGKSTSLNSMLGEKIEIYKGRIKVITVEDPPEYLLDGATQVPVVRSRSQAKSTEGAVNPFASVVRAAMRSDPDILMVGEVRDHSSAELLIHAVQSGHQVFTTIHASSAIDIVARMRSNGIPDDVLGGQNFFSSLMYQTLLPVICKHCSFGIAEFAKKASSEQDFELLQRVFKYMKPRDASLLKFKDEDGCEHCEQGVTGRTVASEVLLPDPYMLQCFRDRQDAKALLHYRHKGGKIALEHGLLKALQGQCDLRDVEHKLDQITLLEELDTAVKVFKGLDVYADAAYKIDSNTIGDNDTVLDESKEMERKKQFIQSFQTYLTEQDIAKEAVSLEKTSREEKSENSVKLEVPEKSPEKKITSNNSPDESEKPALTEKSEEKKPATRRAPRKSAKAKAVSRAVTPDEKHEEKGQNEVSISKDAHSDLVSAVDDLLIAVSSSLGAELARNGLELTPRFLSARLSDASLIAMSNDKLLDEKLRTIIQEGHDNKGVMKAIAGMTADELFERVRKTPTAPNAAEKPRFKSKLLGGEDEEVKARKTRSTKNVQSLDAASARRNSPAKPDDEDDEGSSD